MHKLIDSLSVLQRKTRVCQYDAKIRCPGVVRSSFFTGAEVKSSHGLLTRKQADESLREQDKMLQEYFTQWLKNYDDKKSLDQMVDKLEAAAEKGQPTLTVDDINELKRLP